MSLCVICERKRIFMSVCFLSNPLSQNETSALSLADKNRLTPNVFRFPRHSVCKLYRVLRVKIPRDPQFLKYSNLLPVILFSNDCSLTMILTITDDIL